MQAIFDKSTIVVHKMVSSSPENPDFRSPPTGAMQMTPLLSEYGGDAKAGPAVSGAVAKEASVESDDDADTQQPPAYSMLDRTAAQRRDFVPVSPVEKFFQVCRHAACDVMKVE